MAIKTIPAAVAASMGGQNYGQARYDIMEMSEPTGASAVRVLGPARWVMGLRSQQGLSLASAGNWEAMLLKLRGGVNHLAVYDFLRPAPLGSMRGSPTISADRPVGATTATLQYISAANNLLTEPASFDGATWAANAGLTVTANTTARPFTSTVAADTLTDPGASGSNVTQAVTVADDGSTYTGSIYVRKTTGGTSGTFVLQLNLQGGSAASVILRVNTDTGAILSGTGVVDSVDSGTWWRVSTSITNDSTGNTSILYRLDPARGVHGSAVTSAAATGSAIVWGAQLEQGSAATAYESNITLLSGDWLQFGSGLGSHLCKVVTDADAFNSGVLDITFEPPLRVAVTAGTAVTWDKPLGYYRMRNDALSWSARANGPAIDGFSIDLLEDWGT